MKKILFTILLVNIFIAADAQKEAYSKMMAQTAMHLWKDSFAVKPGKPAQWSYDQGVVLKGIEGVWKLYGDGSYFNYVQQSMDKYIENDGTIRTYKHDDFNIDNINNGRVVMMLYNTTGKAKYKTAIDQLYNQLQNQPRTTDGSFWHKKIYPQQVWLDGLYMGLPFYAEYAALSHQDSAFDDIANQFEKIEQHARDKKTGLLYHGWDESKAQQWANKTTGNSPNFWGRSLGWYGMALVDVLDYFPENNMHRDSLIAILNRFAKAVTNVQDKKSGLWYDVVDMPNRAGNYKEASASCMLAYTLAKAVRKGYLPASYLQNARKAYAGIVKEFLQTDSNGQLNLKGTVSVSGLGGKPYRDGSFDYYISEPVVENDPKGIGAFILCSVEMEIAAIPKIGLRKNVLLDNYFNNEWAKNGFGIYKRHHYTWDDTENGGFSLFGSIWSNNGATLTSLADAPTVENLKKASVYIIVDPDGIKDSKSPNYMDEKAATVIANWVKQGGVLLMMTNDSGNCDLQHFNLLSQKFGIHFTDKNLNMVQGSEFATGAVYNNMPNPVFKKIKKIYLKEISTLELKKPASAICEKNGDVIFATANYGKGKVLAVGDPWIYNEYLDGRKIPAEYENFLGATEVVQWLLKNAAVIK